MSAADTFAKYATDGVLDIKGIVDLAETELGLDLEKDVAFYVLAWQCKAKTPAAIDAAEWESGMKALGCKTIADVKTRLDTLRAQIADKRNFQDFYKWLYQWSKEQLTARYIKRDVACNNWALVLDNLPTGTWVHKDDWLEFMGEGGKFTPKVVAEDLWVQLFVWIASPDSADLSKYSEDAAWPSAIDQFVAWKLAGKK